MVVFLAGTAASFLCGKPTEPRPDFPHAAQGADEGFSANVAGKLQAEITSSLTMWRRMTVGFSDGSKWQDTASLIMPFNSSRESASVKMEKPSARAS